MHMDSRRTKSLGKIALPSVAGPNASASKTKRKRSGSKRSGTKHTRSGSKRTKRTNFESSPDSMKRAAANKIISFFRQTQHTRKARFLESICSDSGVCLAFGQHADDIKKHFGGYTAFDYVISPIKRIGKPSENGFINQIEYEHRGYKSYAILKSAKTPDADNLLYEYIVGQFINRLNKQFPCFLETYGYYMYTKDKYWTRLQKDKPVTDISILKKGLTHLKDVDYYYGCKASQQIAILIQHLKNIQSLGDMSREPDFIENDLMWVLFQLYIPLAKLKNYFTHYDLHLNNIYLYEPVPGKYIEYHYFLTKTNRISFKSSYMLKIIDYGRSYFKDDYSGLDSKKVYADVCAEDECNEPADERGTCGSYVGFGWLANLTRKPADQFYISAQRKNVSHDLLPLRRIKENNTAPQPNLLTPDLESLVNQVVYLDYFGTKERIQTGGPGFILSVSDAAKHIAGYVASDAYQRKNDDVYAGKTKLGDLFVYMNGSPMEFRPA
jgi:hypothetical protein